MFMKKLNLIQNLALVIFAGIAMCVIVILLIIVILANADSIDSLLQ